MKIKKIILALIVILLIASIIFENKLPMVKYFDEILTLAFLFCAIIRLMLKRKSILKLDIKVFLGWLIILVIGLISNGYSHVSRDTFDILLDILDFSKFLIIITCTKYLFSYETVDSLFSSAVKISKLLIIVMFLLSLVSLVFDIGMRGQERFGIYGFNFVFEYAHEFTVFVLCLFAILFLNIKDQKQMIIYTCLTFLILVLTLKGPSILVPLFFLGISSMYKYKDKMKVILIISVLAVICIWVSRYQIVNYLTNENAPRYILFKHGFITAKSFFPFGSGFGTYGSSIAASSYSPLYVDYGFTSLYGMNPGDYQFLNDNYYPMIIGQFGFFGTLIMLAIFVSFFKKSFHCYDNKSKIIALVFLCYFVCHSVGSSILTSSAGVLGILFLALIWIYDEGRANNEV